VGGGVVKKEGKGEGGGDVVVGVGRRGGGIEAGEIGV